MIDDKQNISDHESKDTEIRLQDALYSLRELSTDFSVRELLGLTGDLAIVIKVPLPPNLGTLDAVTFNFVRLGLDKRWSTFWKRLSGKV